jgi:hypothetical protein
MSNDNTKYKHHCESSELEEETLSSMLSLNTSLSPSSPANFLCFYTREYLSPNRLPTSTAPSISTSRMPQQTTSYGGIYRF